MITLTAFALALLVGVPIGLCLCLGAIVYIAASGNPCCLTTTHYSFSGVLIATA